jgi:hypothetical protein
MAATSSGFSVDDADALGVRFVRIEAPVLAEWRIGGAVMAWDGETVEAVLTAIESWHLYRLRCGAAEPVTT